MLFLWNPTGEDFDYTYGGLSYRLEAGKKKRVSEAEGNHVLNALGSRGVTRLVFDDEGRSINEEQIAEDARERNRDFKERQIIHYNERNERRKASGQPYDPPTKEVKRYAVELGIELLKPYEMAKTEVAQVAKVTKENEELKKQLEDMIAAQKEMLESFNSLKDQVNKGYVKPKDDKDPMIQCPVCDEKVLASKLKSHMNHYHKDK